MSKDKKPVAGMVKCKFLEECKKDGTIPECHGQCLFWEEGFGFMSCSSLELKPKQKPEAT